MSTAYFDEFAAGTLTNAQEQTLRRFRLPVSRPTPAFTETRLDEPNLDPESINCVNRRHDKIANFLGILLLAIAAVCLIPLAAWGISSVVSAFSTLQPGEALNSIVGNSMF